MGKTSIDALTDKPTGISRIDFPDKVVRDLGRLALQMTD
jgi:hypothetical protein